MVRTMGRARRIERSLRIIARRRCEGENLE
jgi:hypothetical protein